MKSPIIIALVIAIVLVAVTVRYLALHNAQHQTNNTIQPTNTYAPNNGINKSASLGLFLIENTTVSENNVSISIRLFNNLTTENNLSATNNWTIKNVSLGEVCSTPPFGFVVYKGHYNISNLGTGTPLQVFEPRIVECPAMFAVNYYDFQAKSSNATEIAYGGILHPNANFSFTTPEIYNTLINGTWSGGPWPIKNATLSPLATGTYTVATGDEWGQVVISYFKII